MINFFFLVEISKTCNEQVGEIDTIDEAFLRRALWKSILRQGKASGHDGLFRLIS